MMIRTTIPEAAVGEIFDEVQGHIRDAYRKLIDVNKPDGTGLNLDDPCDTASAWNTLYGHETAQVLLRLREAMMWLQEARLSVG